MRQPLLSVLLLGSVLLALAPYELAAQTRTESALEHLIREWTTGYSSPTCRRHDDWGGLVRSCVQRPAGSRTDSLVTSWYADGGDQVSMGAWDRTFADSTRAIGAVDSIERALEKRQLAASDCAVVDSPAGLSRSSVWTRPSLGVVVTRFFSGPRAGVVATMAVSQPEALPMELLCRDAKPRAKRT